MLDPIEEEKFKEYKSLNKKLGGLSFPEIFINLEVKKDNNLLYEDRQRGHSWVRNMWNAWMTSVFNAKVDTVTYGTGYTACKQTDNGLYNTILFDSRMFDGIYIGTSDTAWSFSQYMLQSRIANGNGTGQMSHGSLVRGVPSYDPVAKEWTQNNYTIFNNNSGGTIVVKETGLGYNNYEYLLERSVITPTVSVVNGAQLTVTYEIVVDFSALET